MFFNIRNPSKVKYVFTPQIGNFEIPKFKKTTSINELHENYLKRLEFEKYMNPKGLKQTITSRFKKPQQEIEFLSHEV